MRERKYLDGKHTILFNVSNRIFLILESSLKRCNLTKTDYLTLLIENGEQLSLLKKLKEELEQCKASKTLEIEDIFDIYKAKKQNAPSIADEEIIDYLCEKYKVEKASFEQFIKNKNITITKKDRFLEVKEHYDKLLHLDVTKEYFDIKNQLKQSDLDVELEKELNLKSFEIWNKIKTNLPQGVFANKAFLDRAMEEME